MKSTLTTTLALLKEHQACTDGYRKLVKSLGSDWPDDKPINLLQILDSNGVQDMCWCFQATVEDSLILGALIVADMAESVLHHFTAKYPNDDRPAKAIQAARDLAAGKITASYAVDYAVDYAADAAANAGNAAYAAANAAANAAYAAANAGNAADAAANAGNAAYAAGNAAERKKQAVIIRKWLT